MDGNQVDGRGRVLGTRRSRRGVLGLLAGMASLGASMGLFPGEMRPVAAAGGSRDGLLESRIDAALDHDHDPISIVDMYQVRPGEGNDALRARRGQ